MLLGDTTNCPGRSMDFSRDFEVDAGGGPAKPASKPETDQHRLQQRQKQIDYGKNTLGYVNYAETVPRNKRVRGQPRTPDKRSSCSKRAFDGLIRKWRRDLHSWDPPGEGGDQAQPMVAPAEQTAAAPQPAEGSAGPASAPTTPQKGLAPGRTSAGSPAGRTSPGRLWLVAPTAGNKRNHPDSDQGGGDQDGPAPKAARTRLDSGRPAPSPLSPLRPTHAHKASAELSTAAAPADTAAEVQFDWNVDGLPDDDEEQVDYELDNTWDADDVGL